MNLQKQSSLINKLPFKYGIICDGNYKGYLCEIIDISSRNVYKCRTSINSGYTTFELSPYQIIPEKKERSKIIDILEIVLTSDDYYTSASKNPEELKTVDYMRKNFKDAEVASKFMYESWYSPLNILNDNSLQKSLGTAFLNIMFLMIKKKVDDIKLEGPKELDESIQNDIEMIDMVKSYNHQEQLGLEDTELIKSPLLNAFQYLWTILGVSVDYQFLNIHINELSGIIDRYNYNNMEEIDEKFFMVAYIFIYYNKLDIQLPYELLAPLNIRVSQNNDPISIVDTMVKLEFFDDQNFEYCLSKVVTCIDFIKKDQNYEIKVPKNLKTKSKFFEKRQDKAKVTSGVSKKRYNHKVPISVPLIDPITKKAVDVYVTEYMISKVQDKINDINSNYHNSNITIIRQKEILEAMYQYFNNKSKKTLSSKEFLLKKFNGPEDKAFYGSYLKEFENRITEMGYEATKRGLSLENIKSQISGKTLANKQEQFIIFIKNDIEKSNYDIKQQEILYNFINDIHNPKRLYAYLANPNYRSMIEPYINIYEKELKNIKTKIKNLDDEQELLEITKASKKEALRKNIFNDIKEALRKNILNETKRINNEIKKNNIEIKKNKTIINNIVEKRKSSEEDLIEEVIPENYAGTVKEAKRNIVSLQSKINSLTTEIKSQSTVLTNFNDISNFDRYSIYYYKKLIEYKSYKTNQQFINEMNTLKNHLVEFKKHEEKAKKDNSPEFLTISKENTRKRQIIKNLIEALQNINVFSNEKTEYFKQIIKIHNKFDELFSKGSSVIDQNTEIKSKKVNSNKDKEKEFRETFYIKKQMYDNLILSNLKDTEFKKKFSDYLIIGEPYILNLKNEMLTSSTKTKENLGTFLTFIKDTYKSRIDEIKKDIRIKYIETIYSPSSNRDDIEKIVKNFENSLKMN